MRVVIPMYLYKALSPPTDSALYHKARRALVKAAQQLNIDLRQSYTRKYTQALCKAHGYAQPGK